MRLINAEQLEQTLTSAINMMAGMAAAIGAEEDEDGWIERNKDRILQAGLEGREVEFRIGGRLFAIREKAQ